MAKFGCCGLILEAVIERVKEIKFTTKALNLSNQKICFCELCAGNIARNNRIGYG